MKGGIVIGEGAARASHALIFILAPFLQGEKGMCVGRQSLSCV